MDRKTFLRNSSLAMALLAFDQSSLFAKDFSILKDQFQFKLLRNDVGIFTESGGTIAWLNSADGFAVVDSQFPKNSEHVIAELKKLKDNPFRFLINTHHHGDHTGGNISFKGIAENVVAHQNSFNNQKDSAEKAGKLDQQLLPNITFEKNWKAKLGKEKIKGKYFGAAHTNGDCVFHFQNANVAHVGDLVFNIRFPFIDKNYGANIESWIEVLENIIKYYDNDTLFIFGHSREEGKITGNKNDIRAFQNYLEKLLLHMKSEIKSGKTKEQILKSTTTIPGAPDWQGDGIERSINAAYQELTVKV